MLNEILLCMYWLVVNKISLHFTSLHTQLHSLCGECPRGTIIVIYEFVILRRDCLGSISNRPTMQISSHTLCIQWQLCLFLKTLLHPSTATLLLCQMDVGISEEVVVPWWYWIHRYDPNKACFLINGPVGNHISGMTNAMSMYRVVPPNPIVRGLDMPTVHPPPPPQEPHSLVYFCSLESPGSEKRC